MSLQRVTMYSMPPHQETITLRDFEIVDDEWGDEGLVWQLYRLRDHQGRSFYTFEACDYMIGDRYRIEWILYAGRLRMIAEITEVTNG